LPSLLKSLEIGIVSLDLLLEGLITKALAVMLLEHIRQMTCQRSGTILGEITGLKV
jgi:hypothetical protein